jgi:hypothetical protein
MGLYHGHQDCGPESHSRHGCLSMSCVMLSCLGTGLVTGCSVIQRSPTKHLQSLKTSHMWGGQGPSKTVQPHSKQERVGKNIFLDTVKCNDRFLGFQISLPALQMFISNSILSCAVVKRLSVTYRFQVPRDYMWNAYDENSSSSILYLAIRGFLLLSIKAACTT